MSHRDPGQDGIQAAREDRARAAERAPGATTKAARAEKAREASVRREASHIANSLHRAQEYLNAALNELGEAAAYGTPESPERLILEAVEASLRQSGTGGIDSICELRDRRAARAGFSFDD